MEGIAWGAMWIWNLGVAGGMAAVYFPTFSGTGLLAEFPTAFDGLLLLGLLMVNGAFWLTLLASSQRLPYISLWFFGLALLAFMGAYALSSAAQAGDWLINLDDTVVALIYAFVARMIFTFWVIGVALGSLFYVVPRATFNALASGGMAFASWILWAGLSGVSALGALVDPVGAVRGHLHRQRGHHPAAGADPPGRGHAGHDHQRPLVADARRGHAGLRAAVDDLPAVDHRARGDRRAGHRAGAVRGTEWATGPIILATLGAATFAHYAYTDHAAPRLLRRDWGDTILTDVQLWASLRRRGRGRAVIGRGRHRAWLADRRWRVDGPDQRDADLVPLRGVRRARARVARRLGRPC